MPRQTKGNGRMVNEDLAKNIRRHREDAGLSQEAAARLIGVSLGTWGKWERAEVDIPSSWLPIIATALKTTQPDLVAPVA